MRTKPIFLVLLMTCFTYALPYYFVSNPAESYLSNQPKINIRYLTLNLNFANNSLNFSSYNNNFNLDPDWDSIQKASIINSIPDLGFKVITDISFAPIEFYSKLFSISVYGQHFGSVTMPKDLFDLALFGNDLNRAYDFSSIEAHSINYIDASLGGCYPVIKMDEMSETEESFELKQLNLGARFHYQKGIFVTQTDSASGYVFTTPNAFLAQAKLFQTIDSGGNCYAFDLGATAEFQRPLSVGFALLNFNTGFNWTHNPQQMFYEINVDSFNIQGYLDFNTMDSFFAYADTTYPIPSFKTSIPAQILIEASYKPIDPLTVSSYYQRYLCKSKFIPNFNQSFNLGLQYTPSRFFALSLSFLSDLSENYKIGNGFHFFVGGFNLNLFVNQNDGLFGKAKGLDCGLSFAQNFY